MKGNDFKSQLKSKEGTKAQEEIAMETVRREVFRAIGNLNLKNQQKGPTLKEIIKKVGNEYYMEDTTKVFQEIKEALDSGNYYYKLDEEGQVYVEYSGAELLQQRKNQKANQTMQEYTTKALNVLNRLPEIVKQEIVKGERVEQEILALVMEKAMRIYQEIPKIRSEDKIETLKIADLENYLEESEKQDYLLDYSEAKHLNQEKVNQRLEEYTIKVLSVLDYLPEIIKQEEFEGKRVKQEILDLAMKKAMKIYQEKQKEEPENEK